MTSQEATALNAARSTVDASALAISPSQAAEPNVVDLDAAEVEPSATNALAATLFSRFVYDEGSAARNCPATVNMHVQLR